MQGQIALPIEQRAAVLVLWLSDGLLAGLLDRGQDRFRRAGQHAPACDGSRSPQLWHRRGLRARLTVDLYFERLKLKRLFCEPHALREVPNCTLQKAGFKYLKTHMTVPGPLDFHQAVNRWMIQQQSFIGSDWIRTER